MCVDKKEKLGFFKRLISVFGFMGDVYRGRFVDGVCKSYDKCLREINVLKNNINAQKELIMNKNIDIEACNAIGKELAGTVKHLESELTIKDVELDECSNKYNRAINKSNDMETKYNKLNTTVKKLRDEVKQYKGAEDSCCVKYTELEKKYKALVKENAANIKELESITSQISEIATAEPVKGKLTCSDIREARKALENGEKIKDLAKSLGVASSTLSKAVRGVSYKHCKEDGL